MTDEAARGALLQQLGAAMSDISEDCYCAGWLGSTEYVVPELCRRAVTSGRTQYWGHGEVTPELGRELTALAERIGAWADLHPQDDGYVPHQPFPLPPQYAEAIEREQSSRYTEARRSGTTEGEGTC